MNKLRNNFVNNQKDINLDTYNNRKICNMQRLQQVFTKNSVFNFGLISKYKCIHNFTGLFIYVFIFAPFQLQSSCKTRLS